MRYHHLIFGAYGFWLPNDPRGSGSARVRVQHLYEAAGAATKVNTTHSVATATHDRAARLAARASLKFPAVKFSGVQGRAIGRGIALQLPKVKVRLYALAVMPDHLHAVAASAKLSDRQLVAFLKASGTRGLNNEGLHPMTKFPRSNGRLPSPWAGGSGWRVWLKTEEDIFRAIAYVENNPICAGLRPQRWSCVTPFSFDREVE